MANESISEIDFWFCLVTNDTTWYHHNIRILCYQYLYVIFYAKFIEILYVSKNTYSSNHELKLHKQTSQPILTPTASEPQKNLKLHGALFTWIWRQKPVW